MVKQDLAKIGIVLDLRIVSGFEMYQHCGDPSSHATFCQVGWGADYPIASTFFPRLYSSGALDGGNGFSLLGASPDQLSKWGYKVQSVPNLDDRIKACQEQIGISQVQCWVAFDQYLMEEIVPAVPLLVDAAPWVFSARVASFSWDQVAGVPTLDRLALKPSV